MQKYKIEINAPEVQNTEFAYFCPAMNDISQKPVFGLFKSNSWATFTIVLILATLLSMLVFSLAAMMMASVIYHIPMVQFGLIDTAHVSGDELKALKLIQLISAGGTFILPPFLVLYFFKKNAPEFLKTNTFPSGMVILQAILLFVVIYPFLEWLIGFNEGMKLPESMAGVEHWMRAREDQLTGMVYAFLNVQTFGGLLANLLIIAIVPAIGEELFFRGMLQNIFKNWFKNIHWAVIVTSVIFSAIHLQFYGFLPRLLLGIILGYLYVWSGSIWTSVIFHFLNNAIAVIYAYLSNINIIHTQWDEPMNSSNFVTVISFLVTAVILIGLAVYYDRRRKNNDDWVKVFSTANLKEAEILKGVLENEEIPAVIMNKRDSSIQTFGSVELFVKKEFSEQAIKVISKGMEQDNGQQPEEESSKDE